MESEEISLSSPLTPPIHAHLPSTHTKQDSYLRKLNGPGMAFPYRAPGILKSASIKAITQGPGQQPGAFSF
jgi:hypothetical protein